MLVSEELREEEKAFMGGDSSLMEVDTSDLEVVDRELLLFTRQLSLKTPAQPETLSHQKSE